MNEERILCIDFGTSYCKYALFHADARSLAQGELATDNAEAPRSWEKTLRDLSEALPEAPTRVAVSGHGPTMLFLSKKGKLCADPYFWYQDAGHRDDVETSFYLGRIRFLVEKYPKLLEKAAAILPFPEYICHLLGADPFVSLPNDEYRPFIWDAVQIAEAGLPEEVFPPFRVFDRPVGYISQHAAKRYSLPEGLPLYCGGTDYLMSLLGSDCLAKGRSCNRAGTSDAVNICSEIALDHRDFLNVPHLVEGKYSAAFFLHPEDDLAQMLTKRIEQVFSHTNFIEQAGLGAAPSLYVVARGLTIRKMFSHAEQCGQKVRTMVLSGGKHKSNEWHQLQANLIGVPLVKPKVVHTELLGLLCLVRKALGVDVSLEEAVSTLFHPQAQYEPEQERLFRTLYENTVDETIGSP